MKRNPGNRLEARIPAPRFPGPKVGLIRYGKRRKQDRPPAPAKARALHLARLARIRAATVEGRKQMVDRLGLFRALRVAGLRSRKGKTARAMFVLDLGEES